MTIADVVTVALSLAVVVVTLLLIGRHVVRRRRGGLADRPGRRGRRVRRVLRIMVPWLRLAAAILVPGGLGLVIGTAASLALDAPRPHIGFLREFLNPAIGFPSDLTNSTARPPD